MSSSNYLSTDGFVLMQICATCKYYHAGHPDFGHDDYKGGWCSRIKPIDSMETHGILHGVAIFLGDPYVSATLLVDSMFGCMLHEPVS